MNTFKLSDLDLPNLLKLVKKRLERLGVCDIGYCVGTTVDGKNSAPLYLS